eukprot:TRINITY_DN12000_c0_g1_i3.p1 TRINITY_DN12000_c0_g1~~TRINITY_DN12000_c0_g1_i3.p1  ORF type:complete len:794 (+),score=173.40 TRINITY_DN12000_c0_g1_i3:85-2382(+)
MPLVPKTAPQQRGSGGERPVSSFGGDRLASSLAAPKRQGSDGGSDRDKLAASVPLRKRQTSDQPQRQGSSGGSGAHLKVRQGTGRRATTDVHQPPSQAADRRPQRAAAERRPSSSHRAPSPPRTAPRPQKPPPPGTPTTPPPSSPTARSAPRPPSSQASPPPSPPPSPTARRGAFPSRAAVGSGIFDEPDERCDNSPTGGVVLHQPSRVEPAGGRRRGSAAGGALSEEHGALLRVAPVSSPTASPTASPERSRRLSASSAVPLPSAAVPVPVTAPRASELVPRPTWKPDEAALRCELCAAPFGTFRRRHHCRGCGWLLCSGCSRGRMALPQQGYHTPVRVCSFCHAAFHNPPQRQRSQPSEGSNLGPSFDIEGAVSITSMGREPTAAEDSTGRRCATAPEPEGYSTRKGAAAGDTNGAPLRGSSGPAARSSQRSPGPSGSGEPKKRRPAAEEPPSDAPRLGDRVITHGAPGWVRFVGRVEGSRSWWLGVELDGPYGDGDGGRDGVRYFSCRSGYGLLARCAAQGQRQCIVIEWVCRIAERVPRCVTCGTARAPARCQVCMQPLCAACRAAAQSALLELCGRCVSALKDSELAAAAAGGEAPGVGSAARWRARCAEQRRRELSLRDFCAAKTTQQLTEAKRLRAVERFADLCRRGDIEVCLAHSDFRGVAGIHPRATPTQLHKALTAKLGVWHPDKIPPAQREAAAEMYRLYTRARRMFESSQEAQQVDDSLLLRLSSAAISRTALGDSTGASQAAVRQPVPPGDA